MLATHPSAISDDEGYCVPAYAVFLGQNGLLPFGSGPLGSNFFSALKIQFWSKLRVQAKKRIRALRDAVLSVFSFVSKFKMERADACPVVLSGALVKHEQPMRNGTMKKDPAYDVGGCDLGLFTPRDATIDLAVPMVEAASPHPTPVGVDGYFCKEALEDRNGQLVQGQICGVGVRIHGSVEVEVVTGISLRKSSSPTLGFTEGNHSPIPFGIRPAGENSLSLGAGIIVDVPNLKLETKPDGLSLAHVVSILPVAPYRGRRALSFVSFYPLQWKLNLVGDLVWVVGSGRRVRGPLLSVA